MSHFSVMVRIDGSTKESQVQDALQKMMIPYKEMGCGSDDPPELKQYLEFNDCTEEMQKEYDTETYPCVRLVDGTEFKAYDNRFRNPEMFAKEQYIYPDGAVEFEKPLKELYTTFDQFATEYHGRKKTPDGKYGYWHNPNDKWDWYTIGGRWSGRLPVLQEGRGGAPAVVQKTDMCRLKDLAWDDIQRTQVDRHAEFFNKYQAALDNHELMDSFDEPRPTALDIGLLTCKNEDELTDDERDETKYVLMSWKKHQPASNRFDVCRRITWEDFQQYLPHFFPIKGYARLDKNGWQAPGEMGWFGCSSDDPDTNKTYVETAPDFFKSGDQNDWIVCVDCHI